MTPAARLKRYKIDKFTETMVGVDGDPYLALKSLQEQRTDLARRIADTSPAQRAELYQELQAIDGARLKLLRFQSGLTWAQMAELFASNTTTLTRWASEACIMPGPAIKLLDRLEMEIQSSTR